jgi:glutaredoxin
MRASSGSLTALVLLSLLLGTGLLLAGCTASAPGQGSPPGGAAVTPAVPSYVVYIPGNDHGTVLLVGRSTCPHCQQTKTLLADMKVGYYWVDLDTLDQAQTADVLSSLNMCGQVDFVPILVIHGKPPCIIGYNETLIRGALG